MRSSVWPRCSSGGVALMLLAAPSLRAQGNFFELPASRAELEQRAVRDSNDPAAHYNVALALWNDEEYTRAQAELRTAVQLDPRFAQAHLALACLPYSERTGLWDEIWHDKLTPEWRRRLRQADDEFSRALMIDPLVDFSVARVMVPPRNIFTYMFDFVADWYDHYQQGYRDFYAGRYGDAERKLGRLIRETANRDKLPEALLRFHGLAAGHLGQYDAAIADFAVLLARSERQEHSDSIQHFTLHTSEYRYLIGFFEQKAARADTARALYLQAAEEDAGLFMAHVHLADLYEAAGVLGSAAAERASAVNIAPDDASLWLDLGRTLYQSGRLAEAEAALTQGRGVNPRDARLAYLLGLTELALGNREGGRAALTAAVALAPSRFTQLVADARQRLAALH
jgi:tetratricopeptide (TPR) repeat protein